MTLDHVLALQRDGAQVLDVRDPAEFAAAHLAGSINIGLGGQYATWAGTVLEPRAADRDHRRPGPRERGGDRGWAASASTTSSATSRTDCTASSRGPELTRPPSAQRRRCRRAVAAARARRRRWSSTCAAPASASRSASPAACSMPLNHLAERLTELPTDRPLLVHCAGGYRSSIAASLLLRQRLHDVSELAGGIAAWETAQLPLQRE